MGVAGPLPEGIVGLVLGRSSLSFQEILVVYGVVDSDYIGEISFDLAASQNCKLIKVKE